MIPFREVGWRGVAAVAIALVLYAAYGAFMYVMTGGGH